jgi:hypothetical protein
MLDQEHPVLPGEHLVDPRIRALDEIAGAMAATRTGPDGSKDLPAGGWP